MVSLSLSLSIGGPYFADSRRTGNLHGLDYDSGCHLADGNNGWCVKRHPKWGYQRTIVHVCCLTIHCEGKLGQ